MRKRLVFCLLMCYFLATGCAAVVVGAGAGAGAYSYIKGELKRTYAADYDQTVEACKSTLDTLKMPLDESQSDGLKTVLKARRADGAPVTIIILVVSPQMTEVGVRCGVVGIRGKRVSKLIHGVIAQMLQP